MDDYIPLHICDDLFPEDIPREELLNKIVIVREFEGQEVFIPIRDPMYITYK